MKLLFIAHIFALGTLAKTALYQDFAAFLPDGLEPAHREAIQNMERDDGSITAESFHTSKAQELDQPSAAFQSLTQNSTIPQSTSPILSALRYESNNPLSMVAAILYILLGFGLVFDGYRLVKPLAFMIGFTIAGMFGFRFLEFLVEKQVIQFGDNRQLIVTIVLLCLGTLGGLIFIALSKALFFGLGGFAGYFLSSILLRLPFATAFDDTARIIVTLASILIGFAVAYMLQKAIIIVGSALFGSCMLAYGIDYFAKTGFAYWITSVRRIDPTLMTDKIYWMVGGVIATAVIGIVIQYISQRKRKDSGYQAPGKA